MGMIKESIDLYHDRMKKVRSKKKRKELKKKFWFNDFLEIINLRIFVIPFVWLFETFYLKNSKILILPTHDLPFEWPDENQLCIGMKCGYIVYLSEFKQGGERIATIIIKPTEEEIWNKMIKDSSLQVDLKTLQGS